MNIELKKVYFSEQLSEETNAFTADIYVDGVKAGYAKNDGHGGSTFYHAYEGKRGLIEKAEKYCKTLPDLDLGNNFKLKMNLEHVIDNLLTDWLKAKDAKKFEKKMEKSIMWGVKDGMRYTQVSFKVPLAQIPTAQLQMYVNQYKTKLKPNEVFLNTNFEKLGIKI